MRKHQIEDAAYEVATQVRAVEDSIECALAELAELQARMVHARSVTARRHWRPAIRVRTAGGRPRPPGRRRGSIGDCHAALADAKQTSPGPSHGRYRR